MQHLLSWFSSGLNREELGGKWRRDRDSNPGYLAVYASTTTLLSPALQGEYKYLECLISPGDLVLLYEAWRQS